MEGEHQTFFFFFLALCSWGRYQFRLKVNIRWKCHLRVGNLLYPCLKYALQNGKGQERGGWWSYARCYDWVGRAGWKNLQCRIKWKKKSQKHYRALNIQHWILRIKSTCTIYYIICNIDDALQYFSFIFIFIRFNSKNPFFEIMWMPTKLSAHRVLAAQRG